MGSSYLVRLNLTLSFRKQKLHTLHNTMSEEAAVVEGAPAEEEAAPLAEAPAKPPKPPKPAKHPKPQKPKTPKSSGRVGRGGILAPLSDGTGGGMGGGREGGSNGKVYCDSKFVLVAAPLANPKGQRCVP